MTSDTKTRLLDAAGELVQTRGYNGFSFHDLAERIGIRTASIHYHFPTKAHLGRMLLARYTDDFMAEVGEAELGAPQERLREYVARFRAALTGGRMCLCGMIGAEMGGVQSELDAGVRAFFAANEAWLARVYARQGLAPAQAQSCARLALSALEGAMMIARSSKDEAVFDDVAGLIVTLGEAR